MNLAAGAVAKVAVGIARELDTSHIGEQQLAVTLAGGKFDLPINGRCFGSRVTAENEHRLRGSDTIHAIAGAAEPQRIMQHAHCTHGPEASLGVDIIAAQPGTEQFLKKIVLFVAQAAGSQTGQGIGAMCFLDFTGLFDDLRQRVAPFRRHRLPVLGHHGRLEALVGIDKPVIEKSTNTQVAVVDGRAVLGGHTLDFIVLDMNIDFALAAALGADGRRHLQLPGAGLELERLGNHGPRGTHRHAVAAEFALVEILVDISLFALFIDEKSLRTDDLVADFDAFFTQNAA